VSDRRQAGVGSRVAAGVFRGSGSRSPHHATRAPLTEHGLEHEHGHALAGPSESDHHPEFPDEP
jgi:hypothetical protein